MTHSADITVALLDRPDAVADEIEAHLTASLKANRPPNDHAALTLVARDGGGSLVGGLLGGTSYGWLLVKALWVEESHRGRGLGARLMRMAEEAARERGCHGAWLDTSSSRAKAFYDRLGYEPFGILENRDGETPQGHSRFFLCKRLTGGAQGMPGTGTEE